MKKNDSRSRAILAALLAAHASGVWAEGGSFYGKVIGVGDGDTITVIDEIRNKHTIRLAFIDAPETSCHSKKPNPRDEQCQETAQDYGKLAKNNLVSLVYQSVVKVDVLPGSTYGREIGIIYRQQDQSLLNVNFEQVRNGYAWFYRRYAKQQLAPDDYELFSKAEQAARDARKGLWSNPSPTPPWEYRENDRKQKFY